MNEVIKAIITRRSIRKYQEKPVSDQLVHEMLKVAMSAPSAHNQQPWQFVVIREQAKLQEIPKFHPYSSMLASADLAILVCGDMKALKSERFWVQDCAAATENILLAAHSLGLGAVWLGVYPKEELMLPLTKLLELPAHIVPFSLISVGYPKEEKPAASRFDEERIHWGKW